MEMEEPGGGCLTASPVRVLWESRLPWGDPHSGPGKVSCESFLHTAERRPWARLFPSSQKEVGVIVSEAVCVDAAVPRLQE